MPLYATRPSTPSGTNFLASLWKYLSLLPLTSTVTGVTLRGLKYLIEDYTLEVGIARAISNEMDETSDKAEILLRTGVLIVVESKD